MVWGAMSAQGLSELHVLPQKQTVDAEHYVTKILEQSLLPALSRPDTTGSVLQRKMVPAMSAPIFMQYEAPAHTSKKTGAERTLPCSGTSTYGQGTPLT